MICSFHSACLKALAHGHVSALLLGGLQASESPLVVESEAVERKWLRTLVVAGQLRAIVPLLFQLGTLALFLEHAGLFGIS